MMSVPGGATSALSWRRRPRLRWFPAAIRNLCSISGTGPARRRCAPPPSVGATLGRCAGGVGGGLTPQSSHQPHRPTEPVGRHMPRQPRFAPAWETGPSAGSTPAGLHPGLAHPPDALPPLTADLGYPPLYAACVPSPSCPHRTLWAPFFRGLHRLTVNYGTAGTGLTAQVAPHSGTQGIMDLLPSAIPPPGPEVVVDRLPGRQVMRQQTPSTAGAQNVPDAIYHLTAGILGRAPARFDRRDQRL